MSFGYISAAKRELSLLLRVALSVPYPMRYVFFVSKYLQSLLPYRVGRCLYKFSHFQRRIAGWRGVIFYTENTE